MERWFASLLAAGWRGRAARVASGMDEWMEGWMDGCIWHLAFPRSTILCMAAAWAGGVDARRRRAQRAAATQNVGVKDGAFLE